MFTSQDFVTCVTDNLKARGFHHKRIKEITDAFDKRAQGHAQRGMNATDASILAMKETFDNMTREATERAKRTAKMLSVQASNNARIEQGLNVKTSVFLMDGKKGNKGVALARAAVSLIEDDPRFVGASFAQTKDVTRGQLYAIFGSVLDSVGKGAFGRQKGKAHLPNIIREIKGQNTGDATAREFATAWLKVQDVGVDLFNQAGGSMRKLDRYIPQQQNSVKILRAGEYVWVRDHLDAVDWNETRWPDGTAIAPGERESVLRNVYKTLSTNGANKIDDKAFRGQGRSVGNQLDNHRFLHYKDADAWLNVHNKYGDGNIFEVFTQHIEDMAHKIAAVETFGPNPELTASNVSAIVRKKAAAVGPKELADADAILKNKFNPMLETIMRENPMDPNSTMGALVTGTANILTAAQLGSASLLAIPGDFMQTAAVRALNNMGMFDGVGYYVKAMATDPAFMRSIATQSGFVMDEVVMSTYSATRFSGVATVGPAVTRRISEAIMRASLLSGHTRSARWAVQAEFMGMLNRYRQTGFEGLPFRRLMERYDISPAEWDAFRNNVKPWTPKAGVEFLRPIDALNSGVPNAQSLYSKLQGMIFEEGRKMIPESTVEASVALKDTTRPDTMTGALLHSFAMYKNFPVSFMMIYGRLGMTSPSVKGRLSFYAGLGAAMTLVGALGMQMREVSKGRDPLPMDNAAFMGQAFLSGGSLGIWGDLLFKGVNQFGGGPEATAAGPLLGFVGDTSNLLLGDVFQFANAMGSLSDKGFESTTAARAVEYAKRYTPGTSVWWARLALERQVWDRLTEIADPKAYRKRKARMAKQKKDSGNDYWWAPGDRTPARLPSIGD